MCGFSPTTTISKTACGSKRRQSTPTSTTRDSEEEEEDGCASAGDDVDEAPLSSHKADDVDSSVLRPAVAILPTHARQSDGER